MVQLTSLLTAAFFAGAALTAPAEKSVREILTDVYGPLDSWTPVYLIDIDPNAIFDGKPVNSSVIYSYEPPADSLKKREVASNLLSTRSLRKRVSTCYNSGNWIFQDQLYSAKGTFCNEAVGLAPGGVRAQNKQLWYHAGSNQWLPFTNNNGQPSIVYFEIRLYPGTGFDGSRCVRGFDEIIRECKGNNPDTAGGQTWAFEGAVDFIKIDPWD